MATDNDKYFMKMALDLATKGQGFTAPNPMVGAVLVKDGKMVGKGYHEAVGTAHAEVNAIDDAGDQAKGATLYVTLEPCNHTGRTPPCTEKILSAGISRVMVAMNDPNPDVRGGGNDYLKSQGIPVTSGVCEAEARQLNEVFIKYVRTRQPFVILKCAMTLDGRIATKTGDAKWVSGDASREYVHQMRHAADGIMVGIGTVRSDDPSLTTRLEGTEGRDPTSVSDEKASAIENQGAKVIRARLKAGRIDLDALMNQLGEMGITSLLVEGGGTVAASALEAGIVDKINFFYAPKILGGDDGVSVCRGTGPELMKDCVSVENIRVRRFQEDVLIEGYVSTQT
ncbi:MAG: riboflavin biosynthesis protein RibD [Desulfobacteraceae bacterium 4572_88]|nr:MAG: riboflavin biosynthesis protein RibD [Desulfobacteraceae bacterium 4572_88]